MRVRQPLGHELVIKKLGFRTTLLAQGIVTRHACQNGVQLLLVKQCYTTLANVLGLHYVHAKKPIHAHHTIRTLLANM